MTNEERLKEAGWYEGESVVRSGMWTRDGINWFTQTEALVVVLTAERDAAIARAERAEAHAAREEANFINTCSVVRLMVERAEAAEEALREARVQGMREALEIVRVNQWCANAQVDIWAAIEAVRKGER